MKSTIKLFQLQLALIDVRFAEGPLEEFLAVNTLIGKPIKATPTVLPFASDPNLPSEIPIVQAGDPTSGYGINVGRSRLDFLMGFEKSNTIDEFIKSADLIIGRYNVGGFGRMGLIIQYFVDQALPTKWIRETFIKNTDPSVEEIMIRFNRKEIYNNMQVNRIVQIQEVGVINNGSETKKAHLQLDINTPVNGRRLTSDMIISLLRSKVPLIKSKLVGEVI
jgi:hypothetical protein